MAHSSGGLIVLSSTGSYVAGTYISTAALASFLTGTAVVYTAGAATLVVSTFSLAYSTAVGAGIALVGTAGWFGTTLGATGLTGLLMRWGILPATPVWVPVVLGVAILGFIIVFGWLLARRVRRLKDKITNTPNNEEAQFTKREARLVEKMILNASKPHSRMYNWLMKILGRLKGRPTSA